MVYIDMYFHELTQKSTIPVYHYFATVDYVLKLRHVSTRINLYWKCT